MSGMGMDRCRPSSSSHLGHQTPPVPSSNPRLRWPSNWFPGNKVVHSRADQEHSSSSSSSQAVSRAAAPQMLLTWIVPTRPSVFPFQAKVQEMR